MLQFQQDRFLHNWRGKGQAEYPRYPTIRARFETEISQLAEFTTGAGIGPILINQCEISYVNHIVEDKNWTEHSEAGRVIRLLSEDKIPSTGRQEHVRFETAFRIVGDDGTSRGRLHVTLVSGVLKEGSKRMFALTLTARGAPTSTGVAGALDFRDLGRQRIVRGFASLTTDRMHAAWGRIR